MIIKCDNCNEVIGLTNGYDECSCKEIFIDQVNEDIPARIGGVGNYEIVVEE